MAFIFSNMLKLFLVSLFCLSVHCTEETYDDINQWLNDPKFLYELQKRLGISEPSTEPETGCFDITGRFARPGDSECNFHAESSKIIKTTESLSQGAKYLREFANISCPRDCSKLCCEDQECDTAVYRNKDDHNCYLFQCGVDSRCVFVHHSDYWMSSISTTVHASHSFSSGAGTISHENELENLGTSPTEPPKPTPKATQPPTQPPTTTTSTTTTTSAPGLGEYCASYETECEDPHAECLMKSCQCRVGYHAKHRVCRKRCQVDEFECDNVAYGPSMRDCIPGVYRCNGRSECVDGSDEENCPSQQQIPDVVNSDNTPFVDKPAEASGGVKKPSPDTGSSSDGFPSSGSKSGGSQSKPADTERVQDKEPGREPVNQGQDQEADKVKIQAAIKKTTPAPIKTKVPVTTKAPVPDTPSVTPDSHAADEESKDQASTNVDSSGSSKEETQSKISDSTDNQSTESKSSNKTGAIEVLFMDKSTVVESFSDNNQGPIVALALGLGITLIMLIFVGCRLRNVKRRLRKGRALHSNEADYLINGMYL